MLITIKPQHQQNLCKPKRSHSKLQITHPKIVHGKTMLITIEPQHQQNLCKPKRSHSKLQITHPKIVHGKTMIITTLMKHGNMEDKHVEATNNDK